MPFDDACADASTDAHASIRSDLRATGGIIGAGGMIGAGGIAAASEL